MRQIQQCEDKMNLLENKDTEKGKKKTQKIFITI